MTQTGANAKLRAVRLATKDVDAAGAFLASVCGVAAVADGDEIRVAIDDAALIVSPASGQASLGMAGLEVETGSDDGTSATLNGIDVQLVPAAGANPVFPAEVILDHVAIGVRDLEASAERWEATTGVSAELIGIHPISNGAFRAARLEIDNRMIELVSPVPGFESALASRIERSGEGPMVLALPAKDLEAKVEHLTGSGVRLLRQDPHWLVHPANPANLLVQLTPRVEH